MYSREILRVVSGHTAYDQVPALCRHDKCLEVGNPHRTGLRSRIQQAIRTLGLHERHPNEVIVLLAGGRDIYSCVMKNAVVREPSVDPAVIVYR